MASGLPPPPSSSLSSSSSVAAPTVSSSSSSTTTPVPSSSSAPTVSSSATASSSFSAAKEKTNHTRLSRLLVDVGRCALQDVFDAIHPPSTLNAVLCSGPVHSTLSRLRPRRILNPQQWNKLFPGSGGSASSANFDVTLLFLLLRNICSLAPPTTGWGLPPLPSDQSMEADLVRIKHCRNELAHAIDFTLSDTEFETSWNDIKAALIRLGGSKYKSEIERLKVDSIDAECENALKVLWQTWEEGEEKILDAVHRLEQKVNFKDTETKSVEIMVKGLVKVVTIGGVFLPWLAGSAYFLRRYSHDPDMVIRLVQKAIIPSGVLTGAIVAAIFQGSFVIKIYVSTLEALDQLWESYKTGEMERRLETIIVTDDLKALAPDDVEKITISISISEDGYEKARDSLITSTSTGPLPSSAPTVSSSSTTTVPSSSSVSTTTVPSSSTTTVPLSSPAPTTVPSSSPAPTTTVPSSSPAPTTTVPSSSSAPTTTVPSSSSAPTTTVPSSSSAPTTVPSSSSAPTTTVPSSSSAPTTVPSSSSAPTTVPSSSTTTTVPSSSSALTTVPSSSSAPTTVPSSSSALTTVPSSSSAPTTVPSSSSAPTTVPSSSSALTTVPSSSAAPTTVPSSSSALTTVPSSSSALTTTVPSSSSAPTTTVPSSSSAPTVPSSSSSSSSSSSLETSMKRNLPIAWSESIPIYHSLAKDNQEHETLDHHSQQGALIIGNPSVGEVMLRGKKTTFSDLRSAQIEVNCITDLLNHASRRIANASITSLTGKEATKDMVLKLMKEGVAIIHIAAHGIPENGEIALAPIASQDRQGIPEEQDYMLTMTEVQQVGIKAQLVVLSCSHSGRGEIRTEGMVGLSRAFLAAGARAVVASLWTIDDSVTLSFMISFYECLCRGESASVSLDNAMKDIRKDHREPKYWAPFFLIGDDVTIKFEDK